MKQGLNGIVFDLEATCEDKNKVKFFDNECIEIGAVKILNGVIVDEFQTYIKPQFTQVNKFCTELTTIKGTDVKDAPLFEEALEKFQTFADGLPLLSWGFYDRKQLEKDSARYGIDIKWLENHRSLKHEYADMIKSYIKEIEVSGGTVPKWLKKKRSWGVESALKREGLQFIGTPHRGIDDAKNIARIYLRAFTN